jgi:outer membrane protein OmpA-like peptidoglycan-associated protein
MVFFRMSSKIGAVLLGTALFALVAGCGKKKPEVEVGEGVFPNDVDVAVMDQDGQISGDNSVVRGIIGEDGENVLGPDSTTAGEGFNPELLGGDHLVAEGAPIPDLPVVYFEYDKDVLNGAALIVLEKNAAYLAKRPELYAVLRGHTDEQGTEEYNVSLGSRRAQSVRDYLIGMNIPADQLQTISFGESLPIVEGDEFDAQNRRVEFFVYALED